MNQEHGTVSIHAENILPIIKKWLYSDKDIFIRETIANACDAVTKHRLAAPGDIRHSYQIIVEIDKEKRTLSFYDNGIGMTDEEIRRYINQVAFSGALEFIEKVESAQGAIIGHFGLGFYSNFMVSERVEIDSLSYLEGAEAVRWASSDGMAYEMGAGTRADCGTTVTLTLLPDEDEFLEESRVRSILRTYCGFMPVPIYLRVAGKDADPEERPVNDPEPLWVKNAREVGEDAYKSFYKETFGEWEDPLFWIHLSVDYPMNLKGILYFPKIREGFEMNEGPVKLYSNQVFVADNVKEIIPDFLLLLKGAIDCPDLPLNVSRSFLQNDRTVKALSAHITKKVADKLEQLFADQREVYEKAWRDIAPFVKFGCLRDEKFAERIAGQILFQTVGGGEEDGRAYTLAELLERAGGRKKLVYANHPAAQAAGIAVMRRQGVDVLRLDTGIDAPLLNFLEARNDGISFVRVDADVTDILRDDAADGGGDAEKQRGALESLVRRAIGDERIKVSLETLKDLQTPAMVQVDERMRRFEEMSRIYGQAGFSMPVERTLLLNRAHPLVAKLMLRGDDARADDIIRQLVDLGELTHGTLDEERMQAFLARTWAQLGMILDQGEN